MTSANPSTRAKTLGWFIGGDIVEKIAMKSDQLASNGSEEKRRRRGQRRPSKKCSESTNDLQSEGSVNSDDLFDEKRKPQRDDYWLYDVASDGYYYEQNGVKGWRRRMPVSAMQKIKEQEALLVSTNSKQVPSPTTSMGGQMSVARVAMAQNGMTNQPSLKYYDPNSDGFFYEMASVDGWRRRQPVSRPPTTSSRSSQNSSYGAALARGQLPRNCVIEDSSSNSSVSGDTASQDPFGSESGFQLADSSTFGISRPNSLGLSDQMLPGFNADKFIEDLSFSGLNHKFLSQSFIGQTPYGQATNSWDVASNSKVAVSPEEESLGRLLKGLDHIWSAPTPVNNL